MSKADSDDGWIAVKPKTRPKKTQEERERIKQNDLAQKAAMKSYYDDMRPAPPPPKEEKRPKAPPKQEKTRQEDEEEVIKVKAISIGQRIKLQKMRNSKGLTREELAKKVNVVVRIVSDYENGKGTFDPATYTRMINALGKLPDLDKIAES